MAWRLDTDDGHDLVIVTTETPGYLFLNRI